MDEDQQAERFDMENDYEGGQWIGGEFYYSKKVEKRKQTKDDVLYGVFQESDSDSGGGRKRRRRDRGPIEKGDFAKPVSFVSSGKVVGSALDDEKEGKAGGGIELGSEQNGSRAGLGSAPGGSGLGFQSGGLGFQSAGLGASNGGLGFQTGGLGSSNGGLGFQSAGPSGAETRADDDEDDLLPGMFGKRIQEAAEKRKEREREEAQKSRFKGKKGGVPAAAAAAGIASFEKHTKGIGMKLMQGMGYVPGQGLGAKGQGIAAPVEAKLRPGKNMGMGYNDYEEKKTALPPPPGKEGEKVEAAAEPAKQEKLWKARNADKRKKKVYKTAGALIEELQHAGAAPAEPTKILDMRGPQVRVLTNLEAINAEQAAVEEDTPMPELQHNLRLMVDLAEAEIQQFDRKLRHERDTMAVLAGEQERLLREVDHYRGQVEGLEGVLTAVEKVQERASEGLMTLQGLSDVFDLLQRKHHEEYKLFNLAAVALSHVLPLMQAHFRGWNPFQNPTHGTAEMATWKKLLAQEEGPRDYSIFTDLDSDIDPYTRLVRDVILPPLRSLVLAAWEPRDPEPFLRFLEAWDSLLPPAVKENIYDQLVMPKLTSAVDTWDPRLETVPIHAWLHPWLPLLAARMEPLYPPIRFKLGAALQAWDPSDSSAYALLHPWQTVFDAASWEQLLVRSIVPKLIVALHTLVINPHAQQLEPFQWFIQWAGAVPVHHMVALLDAHFFPKWQQVLYQWLCAGPNFDEVTRWYLGWKGLFPADLLANSRVQRQLNAALDMMNQAVEGAPVVQPGARENMAYLKVSENRKFEQQQHTAPSVTGVSNGGQPVSSTERDTGYDHGYATLTLKEIVETTAQQSDVQFLPKVGRLNQGLQVYGFGLVSVTIDNHNQMLYAQTGDKWLPVSLEQLIELNRTRTLERSR